LPVELKRTKREQLQETILSALNSCTHSKKAEIQPFWTTEGEIQYCAINCTECDTFLGFLTRKKPRVPNESVSSTVRLHKLANITLFLRNKPKDDNGELKA
jgi:hypothetical protein